MRFFTAVLFIGMGFISFGQNKSSINGILKDSITKQPLPFASITNMNTRQTVLSDSQGRFKISASLNQLLSIASVGYNFDTIMVSEKKLITDSLYIFISPLTKSLETVTVFGKIKLSAYQSDSLRRRKDFFQTMSEHTQPVFSDGNSGAGIGLNLDHFYSREKRKRQALSLFDQIEQEQYINYRFSPTLITKYATLSNDSLSLFIQQYRPTYSWLRKHTTEEDLMYYINDKLKLFFKRKEN